MAFHLIDVDAWERKEYYLHYIKDVVCTYSMQVELDISRLRGQRLYPTMLWSLTAAVNEHEAFRTHLSAEGLGIFDTMNPAYTIFNRSRKNFSAIWTSFNPDYREFLERYLADTEQYRSSTVLFPKPDKPANCFDVSMIPWTTFTAFNLNVYDAGKYLLPIFTMGKPFARDGKELLPLSIQVHHAVCDGYHVAQLIETLQEKIERVPLLANGG